MAPKWILAPLVAVVASVAGVAGHVVARSQQTSPLAAVLSSATGAGHTLVFADGSLAASGDAAPMTGIGGLHLAQPVIGAAATPDGAGAWLVAGDGGVFPVGDAAGYGSTGGRHLNRPVVGIAATPSGRGYWLVASDGGVFPFGDAGGYGSTGGIRLNQPVVAMAATASGHGYWLVASDGGVFPFGDAAGYGSTGNIHLNRPIVAVLRTPSGLGYTLVASDGGVFPFGDAVGLGSLGNHPPATPVTSATMTPSGWGYWVADAAGEVFTFGDADRGTTTVVAASAPVATPAAAATAPTAQTPAAATPAPASAAPTTAAAPASTPAPAATTTPAATTAPVATATPSPAATTPPVTAPLRWLAGAGTVGSATSLAFSNLTLTSTGATGATALLPGGAKNPDMNAAGTMVVFERYPGYLWLMNRDGSNVRPLSPQTGGGWMEPRFAPDGHTVVTTHDVGGGWQEIFTVDALTGATTQLTSTGTTYPWKWRPSIDPTGTRLIVTYGTDANTTTGPHSHVGTALLGHGLITDFTALTPVDVTRPSYDGEISPDGQHLVFDAGSRIWVANADGSNAVAVAMGRLGRILGAEPGRVVFTHDAAALDTHTQLWSAALDGSDAHLEADGNFAESFCAA